MDLAIISAGETDMETARITCLHASCLGFAPLIFDLENSVGFSRLMRICEPVWNAVDADPKLPEKLVIIGKKLLRIFSLAKSVAKFYFFSVQIRSISRSLLKKGPDKDLNRGMQICQSFDPKLLIRRSFLSALLANCMRHKCTEVRRIFVLILFGCSCRNEGC